MWLVSFVCLRKRVSAFSQPARPFSENLLNLRAHSFVKGFIEIGGGEIFIGFKIQLDREIACGCRGKRI